MLPFHYYYYYCYYYYTNKCTNTYYSYELYYYGVRYLEMVGFSMGMRVLGPGYMPEPFGTAPPRVGVSCQATTACYLRILHSPHPELRCQLSTEHPHLFRKGASAVTTRSPPSALRQ